MLVLYFNHPNIHHARYKMPYIVDHHDNSANFKIKYGTNYMSYIDILFICKQIFDENLKGSQIRDEKWNTNIDDSLKLHVFSVHKG